MSSKRIVLGSFLSTLHLILQIVIAFFLTPLMIKTLGDRNYGIWIILSTIIGYYGLLDLGISGAVQRFVSKAIGSGNQIDKKYISSTAFYLFFGIGFIVFLLTFAIWIFIDRILNDPHNLPLIRSVLIVLGIGVSITFPFRIFVGILNANLRFDISRYIEIGVVFFRTFLIVYVLLSSGSLYLLAIATVASTIIEYFLMFIFAMRIDQDASISPKYFDIKRLKIIIDFSLANFVSQLAKIISERSGPIIIAKIVSAAAVTTFSVAFSFINYFMQLIYATIGVIGPIFGQDDGRNDKDRINKNFFLSINICYYISIFCCSMSILYGDEFIVLWLGKQYDEVYIFLVILMIPSAINLGTAPIYYLLNNISKHRELSIIQISEGLIIIILSIILCKHYGTKGVVYGYAIPIFIFSLFVRPLLACKSMSILLSKFYVLLLWNTFIAVCLIVIPGFFIYNFTYDSYLSIISAISFHLIIYIIGCFNLGFKKVEKKLIINTFPFLKMIIPTS